MYIHYTYTEVLRQSKKSKRCKRERCSKGAWLTTELQCVLVDIMSVCMTFHLHKTLHKAKQNRFWRTKCQKQTVLPNNLFVWINTITAKFDTLFHSFGLISVDLIQFDASNNFFFQCCLLSIVYLLFLVCKFLASFMRINCKKQKQTKIVSKF